MNIRQKSEDYLQKLYDNNDFIIIDNHEIDNLKNLQGIDLDILNTFHAQDVFMVERNDSRFCGIRANHFVVEIGWSEALLEDNSPVYVITANHKGDRVVTVFIDWFIGSDY